MTGLIILAQFTPHRLHCCSLLGRDCSLQFCLWTQRTDLLDKVVSFRPSVPYNSSKCILLITRQFYCLPVLHAQSTQRRTLYPKVYSCTPRLFELLQFTKSWAYFNVLARLLFGLMMGGWIRKRIQINVCSPTWTMFSMQPQKRLVEHLDRKCLCYTRSRP